MRVIIDGADIRNRAELHDALFYALMLPEWYGRNLDALHDCLTDLHEKTELYIKNPECLIKNLGVYGNALWEALNHAQEENPYLQVILDDSADKVENRSD